MTYEEAKQKQNILEQAYEKASEAIRNVPNVGTGQLGLVPDSVKATPEYQKASKEYNKAFQEYRNFNRIVNKTFRKEMANDRAKRTEERTGRKNP